ncbi:MAG: class I SAM-dependent methyltransferase [Spirosomataceae bacterium]
MAEKESLIDKLVYLFKRKVLRDYRTKLNYQYKHGGWDWLGRLDEQGHHFVMAGYIRYLKPNAKVLDLGAGEGILNDALQKQNYSRYVGVDLSDEAANMGNQKRGDEKTIFQQGDMDKYVPDGKYDIIVINEALYFSKAPLKLLNRLEAYLEPEGFFLISLLVKAQDIWQELNTEYDFVDENTVINIKGETWTCRILKRRQ